MNLASLLKGTGELLQGMNNISFVERYLQMSDADAYDSIAEGVAASSIQDIDQMDVTLLTLAVGHPDENARLRLVKLYAIFKIAELARFNEFRGFPA